MAANYGQDGGGPALPRHSGKDHAAGGGHRHHGSPGRGPPRQGGRQRAVRPALHGGRTSTGGRHQDSKCPAGSRHQGLRRSAAC